MAQTVSGTNPLRADDYYLATVNLITPKNVVDIRSMLVEISYYEDIFRGSVTGEILISDSINMIDRLGLCGGEFLYLVFRKTKNEIISEGVSKKFRIYRVGERRLQSQETETYTLHFCSEEFFFSEQMKISKAYRGKKISEMASDVLLKELQISKDKLQVEDTTGLYDFIVPYKSPFETLHWLTNYAFPTTSSGADFLFFENHNGFNFTSLQTLYGKNPYRAYRYEIKNLGNLEGSPELERDMRGIKSYTYLDTFDTLYGTSNGAFASKTLTIDPTTRQFYETVFDYDQNYNTKNSQIKLNKFAVINNTPNRQNKTMNQMSEACYKVVVSNKNQIKAKGISENPWTVQNDIGAEIFVPYRTAQIALSHYTRVKLVLSGDPLLSVGTIIKAVLPSNASKKDGSGLNEGLSDVYNSGNYLISAVRHIIKADLKYDTVIEIVKDSMGESFPNWPNNSGINNVVKGK